MATKSELNQIKHDTDAASDALFVWLHSQGIDQRKSVVVLGHALARLLVASNISAKSARLILGQLIEYTVMNIKLKRKRD